MEFNEMDRWAIERLLSDFAWNADRGDGEALSQLFVENGVLSLSGIDYTGRMEIADTVARRAQIQGRHTRHMWSNLRIVSSDTQESVTTAIQITFERNSVEGTAQVRVNDLVDIFQRDMNGMWLFRRRTIQREMALTFSHAER